MTKLWGPLGWMTLHSISAIYPETPSLEEKMIASRFLSLFENTITCRFCQDHFRRMRDSYSKDHPEFLNSRRDFFLFVARAHNTVNKRLDKPRPQTVKECIETLKLNTRDCTTPDFRAAYLNYLMGDWNAQLDGLSFLRRKEVAEMIKINNMYWNPRDSGIADLVIEEGDILTPIEESRHRIINNHMVLTNLKQIGGGFQGGRLQLGRR